MERLGLGIVELDNGARVTGQIDIDEPELGMAVEGSVEVVRHEQYTDYWGLVFHAA